MNIIDVNITVKNRVMLWQSQREESDTEAVTPGDGRHIDLPDPEDEMHRELERLNATLLFISRVKENEKIDTQTMTVSEDGWFTAFWRTFISTNEDKNTTYEFIRQHFHRTLAVIEDMDDTILMREQLKTSLVKALDGIKKLKVTYKKDRYFCSQLDTLSHRTRSALEYIHQ